MAGLLLDVAPDQTAHYLRRRGVLLRAQLLEKSLFTGVDQDRQACGAVFESHGRVTFCTADKRRSLPLYWHYNRIRIQLSVAVSSVIHSPLSACLALISLWGLIAVVGLLRPMSLAFVGRTLFPLGALCGVALALVALLSLGAPA